MRTETTDATHWIERAKGLEEARELLRPKFEGREHWLLVVHRDALALPTTIAAKYYSDAGREDWTALGGLVNGDLFAVFAMRKRRMMNWQYNSLLRQVAGTRMSDREVSMRDLLVVAAPDWLDAGTGLAEALTYDPNRRQPGRADRAAQRGGKKGRRRRPPRRPHCRGGRHPQMGQAQAQEKGPRANTAGRAEEGEETMTADEFRDYYRRKDACRARFCALWAQAGGEQATTAELLKFAERAGLPVVGKTLKGRLISVGLWVRSLANFPIKGDGVVYTITPAPLVCGYRRWRIAVSESQVEQNFQ
jgi:hypothetical protein